MPERVLESELEYDDYEVFYRNGQPFNGVCYRLDAEGRLEAEREYVDGVQWGYGRTWFPSGMPEYDNRFWRGLPHGLCRHWHENGQLAEEAFCELGIGVRERRWDRDGNLIGKRAISDADRQLAASRQAFAEFNPPPPDFEETPPLPRPDPP